MSLTSLCSVSTFTTPSLFGADILSINASLVTGYSTTVLDIYWFNHPTTTVTNATFCNVTVAYTHPGQNDYINLNIWLPSAKDWNSRLMAVGGGGWVAGGTQFFPSTTAMSGAVGTGYATMTSDAGLGAAANASSWALLSEGNVNLYNLQNLASVSLNDEAIIGKSIINDFYGTPPKYSYWSGCSQGGRQGLMLAQRYPTLYDGIAASAPAIYWNSLFMTMIWPQLIMSLADSYPHGCELDFITASAVSSCDDLDGVTDGLISDIKACTFDPFSVVGTVFNCSRTSMQISQAAAMVANATWSGPVSSDGKFLAFGQNRGADLSGSLTGQALAATSCTGDVCVGAPISLGTEWPELFIRKGAGFNLSALSHGDYDQLFHEGYQQFNSIIGTDDPDLSDFRAAGGKMIAYHGLADQVIPTSSTENYYDAVTALDSNIQDFYRFFLAPGIQHCSNGNGGQPTATFDALVAWVENGTVPETLPVQHTHNGTTFNQILCPYPAKVVYDGTGDPTVATSYSCS